jgi:predicted hydrocarbon binding protein
MCAFGEGIIEQAAVIYNEKISITQSRCMLKGDGECEILVTRISN